jgi:hypothetical protein
MRLLDDRHVGLKHPEIGIAEKSYSVADIPVQVSLLPPQSVIALTLHRDRQ